MRVHLRFAIQIVQIPIVLGRGVAFVKFDDPLVGLTHKSFEFLVRVRGRVDDRLFDVYFGARRSERRA